MMLEPRRHRKAVSRFFEHFSLVPGGPVLSFLEQLMDRYTTIPYENLSKIIKRGSASSLHERLRLPEEVIDDHIERKLGGTCFSLSFFLMTILHQAGLDAYICMADMGMRENVHCVTVVNTTEGKFLLDPGYVINRPVLLTRGDSRTLRTPHTFIRLHFEPSRGIYELFTGDIKGMKLRYRFRDIPVEPERFLEHWQRSFDFAGMNAICVSLRRGESLLYMHGDYYRESRIDGFSKRRLKGSVFDVVTKILGVDGGTVEEAMSTLDVSLERRK